MQLSNIKILQDIPTLLNKLDEYIKKYNNVTFYCRNLNSFYHNDVLNLNTLSGTIMKKLFDISHVTYKNPPHNYDIKIITPNFIDKGALIDGKDRARDIIKRSNNNIKIQTIIDETNPIEQFIKKLIDLANKDKKDNNKVRNFNDAINELVKNYDKNKKSIIKYLDELKDSMIKKAQIIVKNENFTNTDEIKKSIDNAFNKLKNNIEDIRQDSEYGFIIKEIVKALIGIIDFTDFKKSFKPIGLLMSAGEIYESGTRIYDYIKNKNLYTFAGPLANLLASEFGFIFSLLNQNHLSNVLVFKDKNSQNASFIDFSGFDIYGIDTKSNISGIDIQTNIDEYLGVCGDLILDEDKTTYLNNNPFLSNSVCELKNSKDFFDFKTQISNIKCKDKNININICKNTGATDENTNTLYKSIKDSIVSNVAHFVYIQHPLFNSLKFAKLIKDKSTPLKNKDTNLDRLNQNNNPDKSTFKDLNNNSDKSTTSKDSDTNHEQYAGLNKNYLVISNAPLKANAKLSEYIIQTALSYKINDENNRGYDKDLKAIKPEDITQVKDYSKYSISINAKGDEDLYLLSLSPFVRISNDRIQKMKYDMNRYYKELNSINTMGINTSSPQMQDAVERLDNTAFSLRMNLAHIDSSFKTYLDMQSIKDKEKELLKASISEFKGYFRTINAKHKFEISEIFNSKKDDHKAKKDYLEDGLISIGYDSKAKAKEYIEAFTSNNYFGKYKITTNPHSAIDIFLLATTFYIIKQKFSPSMIEPNSTKNSFLNIGSDISDGEYISIYNERFRVLNDEAFLQTDKGKKRVYFFKQTMENAKEENAICIEQIVEEFEQSLIENGTQIFTNEFYEHFKKFESEHDKDFINQTDEETNNESIINEANKNNAKLKELNSKLDNELIKDNVNFNIKTNNELNNKTDEEIEQLVYEEFKKDYDGITMMKLLDKESMSDDDYKFYIDLSLTSIIDEVLKELFPFYGYFTGDAYLNIAKDIAYVMFYKSDIKELFIQNIGELRVFMYLNNENIKAKLANKKVALKLSKKLKNKAFADIVRLRKNTFIYYEANNNYSNKNKNTLNNILKSKNISNEQYLRIYKSISLKVISEFFKSSSKTSVKAIATGSALNFIIDSIYISEYEKQKRRYEDILHKYYTHKYDEVYAIKNISLAPMSKDTTNNNTKISIGKEANSIKQANKTKEYTYYPLNIYSSFINIDLKRTIIGGRLCSGGLDYHKFFYYDIDDTYTKTNQNISKDMPLDKLIAYLCLDELRTTYKDDQSFFNYLKTHDMKFTPKELMVSDAKRALDISETSFMGYEQRQEIYNEYLSGTEEETEAPIDKYNEAMEILQDFKDGIFNTDTAIDTTTNANTTNADINTTNIKDKEIDKDTTKEEKADKDKKVRIDNKARRLLKALDVIGLNNIKGIYVGCKAPKNRPRTDKEIPPRLIGRLATTIIMEDGLFIG